MNWKKILPPEIDLKKLSFEDYKNFKNLYKVLEHINNDLTGPPGFNIFYRLLHYLLLYGSCCVIENKFPALSKCWKQLSSLFLKTKYYNEWLVYCWIFCDFPLNLITKEVFLDDYINFCLEINEFPEDHVHVKNFVTIMKNSRLGLYQEIASTNHITIYRELFTNKIITTVRSVPHYESGEIFLTRIISYLGNNFMIHDACSYPAIAKLQLEQMVGNKLKLFANGNNSITNYDSFMKLAGPYWMSCTHTNSEISILLPDEYLNYHKNQ